MNSSIPDGESSWGSNYGSALDLVAPGVRIPTTSLGNSWITNFNGTSAAAPHVSAVAALILSINSALTYREVAYIIERSANKQLPGYVFNSVKMSGTWNTEVGYGLLNAYDALVSAKSTFIFSLNCPVEHKYQYPVGKICLTYQQYQKNRIEFSDGLGRGYSNSQ